MAGASNDLQIYHDGSNSYIQDTGTGTLNLQGSTQVLIIGANGEIGVQYVENAGVGLRHNNIQKLGTSSTGVTITGVAVADGLDLGDNEKIRLGASQDLEIYHDGSNSYIKDTGTGNLFIQAAANVQIESSTSGENMAVFNENGAVELMYDNSKKFETTDTGVSITGNVVASGDSVITGNMTITNTLPHIDLIDSDNNDDFRIRNNSGVFEIFDVTNTGARFKIDSDGHSQVTGNLQVDGNQVITGDLTVNGTTTTVNTQTLAVEDPLISLAKDNSANSVDIGFYGRYNDGSNRYAGLFSDASDSNKWKLFKNLTVEPTTTVNTSDASFQTGHLVVGDFNSEGTATFTSTANFSDNAKAQFGNANDLQIYHDGTNSIITDTGTGILFLRGSSQIRLQGTNESNMIIANESGSVHLYHNNSERLATNSTGIAVTGSIIVGDSHTIGNDASDNLEIASSSGESITLNSANKIILDADGNDIFLQNNGVQFGVFGDATGAFHIDASVQDDSIKFRGNDGGSTITALTLDMSNAGRATFNENILIPTSAGAISGSSYPYTTYIGSTANATFTHIQAGSSDKTEIKLYGGDVGDKIEFTTNSTVVSTISSAGDFLMGNTVVNPASGFASQKGFGYDFGTGQTQIATTDNASTLVLGRNNATDGTIIDLRKESTVIGTLGSNATSGEPVFDISASSSSGHMRFLTNGSEAIRINKTQNVGVGLSAPIGKVHAYATSVNGATDYNGQAFCFIASKDGGENAGDEGNGIVFTQQYHGDGTDSAQIRTGAVIGYKVNPSGQFGGGLKFKVQQSGANPLLTSMTLTNTGKVGIFDDNPESALEVNESGNYKGVHIRGSNAPNVTFAVGTTSTAEWKVGISGNDQTKFAISKGTTNDDSITIDTSHNTIIKGRTFVGGSVAGNSTSGGNLVIDGSGTFKQISFTSDVSGETEGVSGMVFIDNTGANSNDLYLGGGLDETNAMSKIIFKTAANNTTRNGTERMSIVSDGTVNIGGSISGYGTLNVSGTSAKPLLALRSTSGKSSIGFYEGGAGMSFIETNGDGSGGIKFIGSNASTVHLEINSNGHTIVKNDLNVEGGIYGKSYTQTSAGSVTSVIDTGIAVEAGVWELFYIGNANNGGSSQYRSITTGLIIITVDYTDPHVVNEIKFEQTSITGGGSSDISLPVAVKILQGGSEYDELNIATSGQTIRLKITGWAGTVGSSGQARITRRL